MYLAFYVMFRSSFITTTSRERLD